MAISYVDAGANGSGTTTAAAAYPAGAASDIIIALVGNKPFGNTPTQATYGLPLGTVASGAVANGNGTGSVRASAYHRPGSPTGSGTETFSTTSGSPTMARALRFARGGTGWTTAAFTAADTDETGTGVSAVSASLAAGDIKSGDWVVIVVAIKDDVPNHTSQTLTIAGCTVGTITWQSKLTTTSGNDGALYTGYAEITAGDSSGAITYGATSSVSGASSTAVVVTRIREVSTPTFYFVGDGTAITADEQSLVDTIVAGGHAYAGFKQDTVTPVVHPATFYVLGPEGASAGFDTWVTSLTTAVLPYINMFHSTWDNSKLQHTATAGQSSTFTNAEPFAHDITTLSGLTVGASYSFLPGAAANSSRVFNDANLAGAVAQVLDDTAASARVAMVAVESGALLADGVTSAHARMVGFGVSSANWNAIATADAETFLQAAADWVSGINPPVLATPTTLALTLTTFAPTVTTPRLATPSTASLTITTFAPTVTVGANTVVTPPTLALALATFAPTVTATDHKLVTPTTAGLTIATFAPTVTATAHLVVIPTTAPLTITTFAPTVSTSSNQSVTPTTATLTLTTFAPTVSTPRLVTPTTAGLTITTFAPTVSTPRVATPSTASLVVVTFAPTVTVTDHKVTVPGTVPLTITTFAPTVTVTDHISVTPATAQLIVTGYPPTVTASANVVATPGTATLTITGYAPNVAIGNSSTFTPDPATLVITGFAPTVTVSNNVRVSAQPATALTLTTFAPTVSTPRVATPTTLALTLTTFAPTVTTPRLATPSTASLTITTFAPTVTVSGGSALATPTTAALVITTFAPTVTVGGVVLLYFQGIQVTQLMFGAVEPLKVYYGETTIWLS